jgi:hypothetical protein
VIALGGPLPRFLATFCHVFDRCQFSSVLYNGLKKSLVTEEKNTLVSIHDGLAVFAGLGRPVRRSAQQLYGVRRKPSTAEEAQA